MEETTNMDKLKMHSPNVTQDNIARIRELFPDCVTEAQGDDGQIKMAIDFDQLRQELAEYIVEGPQERYHLNWPGKREALLTANAPIAKTLRPCREESVDFDTTQNLFIEGDNLDALKLLQETYLGQVKLIYMDPPYNTGSDFIYTDDFSESCESYLLKSNQKDQSGNRLVANPESNGRFHSDWMTMIYPRLRLAKTLLAQDGAIFVSCDEVEQARLRLVMDEVFGMGNFVADMVWAAGRKNDSKLVSVSHEYIVCYARDKEYLKEKKVLWRQRKKGLEDIYAQYEKLKRQYVDDYAAMTTGMKEWFKQLADSHPAKAHKHYCHVDAHGVYFPDNISSLSGSQRPRYEIPHPITKKPVAVPSRGWGFTLETLNQLIADDRVAFGPDHTVVPTLKSYLKDREYQAPYSVFYQDGRAATKRLRELMGGDFFDFPKDETVLQEIVGMMTSGSDVIMDLFAGSATMAHGVLAQNAVDGENRRFVMVQLPEPCAEVSPAFNAGYKSIADIGKERIRRAGKKVLDGKCHDGWNKDVGFRVLKVDTSNMADVYYAPDALDKGQIDLLVDNIRSDRTAEDLLFQVILDWGVDLALPLTKQAIQGKEAFFVDGNALAACFDNSGTVDEAFVKELAKHQPLRVVFRDAGFKDSAVKINVEQIFKLLSPATEVKHI